MERCDRQVTRHEKAEAWGVLLLPARHCSPVRKTMMLDWGEVVALVNRTPKAQAVEGPASEPSARSELLCGSIRTETVEAARGDRASAGDVICGISVAFRSIPAGQSQVVRPMATDRSQQIEVVRVGARTDRNLANGGEGEYR